MKKNIVIDGNGSTSNISYMFSEISGIYPITPSSTMAEKIDEWSNKGRLNIFGSTVNVVEMQSEAGAAALIHGSLQSGLLSTTYTASQGLLLMIPNMYKMAGEMLPAVIHVAARSLSTHALSIFGDHQDIYAVRQTGFCMLASSSVVDTNYMALVAHLSAIKSSLPFLHFNDGFRTSHEVNKIDIFEENDIKHLIDYESIEKFKNNALNPLNPVTRGVSQTDDIYFQSMEVKNTFYNKVPDIVNYYMQEVNKLNNTNYQPFNYYGSNTATNIIVAMGSVNETIKETIDDLNKKNYNVGLIEVHLYRPFSVNYLNKVLPATVKNIAVLDRTKEHGSVGEPLYLDVVAALNGTNIKVVGGRFGLSSKNTTPREIKAVYDMLNNELKNNFTIGINDDVTNLSLQTEDNYKISDSNEVLIYGYGSDGMVSASKSFIEIIGENTNKDIQAYFEYDSKKSGGVTISHLRINDKKIRSTYFVEDPELIVISKDTYLKDFDCLNNIKENGTIIINTTLNEEVLNYINYQTKELLTNRNIKIYIINAYELAKKSGLNNKISMIMESAIFLLTNYIDPLLAYKKLYEDIKERFTDKGEEIIKANYNAIDSVKTYIKEIKIELDNQEIKPMPTYSMFEQMIKRKGNKLPVSSFLTSPDGTFEAATSKLEKKSISEIVPTWLNENCIQCNQCAFVCPHGVIRPFLLNEEEYIAAPQNIKDRCLRPFEKNLSDYYYIISVSINDCTGCGLCIKTCPGKMGKKALEFNKIIESKDSLEQDVFDYLVNNIKEKEIDPTTIKASQFRTPCFEFSGACAGCGETSYLKLLTQLYKEKLVIANATGCSSIYGGSAPSTPYNVPWASSLFEDNAEYAYGMVLANETVKDRIKKYMTSNLEDNKELFTKWLENVDDYKITKEVYDSIDYNKHPFLKANKDYILARTIWAVGGDGWAYDIGFSGIDHVLSSNSKIRILVLDTQVYSNTGGQSSKATEMGSIAAFASKGKKTHKKDLAKIALTYPNAYVAQVSMGANLFQTLKTFKEAENHDGPSIIIAYSPCIAHGIKGGLSNTLEQQKLAATSGYFPTFRYDPKTNKMNMDTKEANFELYDEFLNSESRYTMLKKINEENAEQLLNQNKEESKKRFEYYKSLEKTSE